MIEIVLDKALQNILLDMIRVMRVVVGSRSKKRGDSLNLLHLTPANIQDLMTEILSDKNMSRIHQVASVSNVFCEVLLLDSEFHQCFQGGVVVYFNSTLFWRAFQAVFFGQRKNPIALMCDMSEWIEPLCYVLGLVRYCSIRVPALYY